MIKVGAYEAKTRLSELLVLVSKGEVVTITKHDHPIAMLTPVVQTRDRAGVLSAMADLRRSLGAGAPVDVREWIDEGRRT